MAKSLQEQLLQSGVAKPKQAKKARREKTRSEQEARRQGKRPDEDQALAQSVAAAERAKRERDRQLADRHKAERSARENSGAAAQLIAQRRIKPGSPGDDTPGYSYSLGGRIRRLDVSPAQRQQLADGQLAVVRHRDVTSLVNRATAERLLELIPNQVWLVTPNNAKADPDDPYAGYEVPDDLMW
ncbi:MAG: DUF2058 family protein [Salinisphaera sp.]|jgi:uncharacterized protein YaiL (DUF2058 family)|nr:DUF2058 family protein [Salinisphaera sp.]